MPQHGLHTNDNFHTWITSYLRCDICYRLYISDEDVNYLNDVRGTWEELVSNVGNLHKQAVHKEIFLYFVAKQLWQGIFSLVYHQCGPCLYPEKIATSPHTCLYLMSDQKLKDESWSLKFYDKHFDNAMEGLNWIELNTLCKNFAPTQVKACSSVYWRSRNRNLQLRAGIRKYITHISVKNGFSLLCCHIRSMFK